MYVILGATGNTGSIATDTLLANKQPVRAVGRSKEHLARFTARGAETFVADVTDSAALTKAFKGAQGVYAADPVDYDQPRLPRLSRSSYKLDREGSGSCKSHSRGDPEQHWR